jgi:GTP cyclohydrolase II
VNEDGRLAAFLDDALGDRVPLVVEPHERSLGYLRTKRERMGHLIEVG